MKSSQVHDLWRMESHLEGFVAAYLLQNMIEDAFIELHVNIFHN
jgi:hypothetical protein